MVKLLLNDPRVDPSTLNNSCLLISAKNETIDIFKLLLNYF
jgi:hypothetical protein